MKKIIYIIIGLLLPLGAEAINITVPQSTGFGVVLRGNANGTYTPVATSTLGLTFSTTSANYWITTKSTSDLAEGSNLYYLDSRARASLSALAPISYNSSTGEISCPTCGVSSGNWATTSQDYYNSQFRDWLINGAGSLTPTTTRPILANSSTTLQNFTGINATTTQATTTNLAITSIISKILKTNGSGTVVEATAGVDYQAAGTYVTSVGGSGVISSSGGTTPNITVTGGSNGQILAWLSGAPTWTATTTFATTSNSGGWGFTGQGTQTLNIPVQDGTQDRGLLNKADWNVFNNKISSTSLSGTSPIVYNSSTGEISCPTCGVSTGNWSTTSQDWYNLSFRDWKIINANLTPTTTIGVMINASSSISSLSVINGTTTNATTSNLTITSLTSELLEVDPNGKVGEATAGTDYEVPLTFGDGLTRTVNDVDVDTTQNIAVLSNLTSNGFVKTSGGVGTLSVDTSTYLTGNQTITLSGVVQGSGTTGITTSYTGVDPRSWNVVSGYLTPTTTTYGILVNNSSSTITNLMMVNSTSTNATSTNLFATTASTTNFYGAGLPGVGCTGSNALQYDGAGKFSCAAVSGGYSTIQNEGTPLTQRSTINFTGSPINCTDSGGITVCDVTAGAATAGGSDTQMQFNDSTALAGAGVYYLKTTGRVGFSTTTPYGAVQISTSTQPQLVLSNPTASLDLKHWYASSSAGVLSFGLISDDLSSVREKVSFSSSTYPQLLVGATTTLNNRFSVQGTSTNTFFGSSTVLHSTNINIASGTQSMAGNLFNEYVVGRRFQNDPQYQADFMGWSPTFTADQAVTAQGPDRGLFFDIDGGCTGSAAVDTATLNAENAYSLVTPATVSNACHLDTGNVNSYAATSSPWMEIRLAPRTSTTTEAVLVGFSKIAQNNVNATTSNTTGVYFFYSPETSRCGSAGANPCNNSWNAISRSSVSTAATTTLSSTFAPTIERYQTLYISYGSSTASFFIDGNLVAQQSGTIPPNQQDLEVFFENWTATAHTWIIDYIAWGTSRLNKYNAR